MTEAEAKEAISQRWIAAWEAAQPTIPYALGNEAYPAAGVASFAVLAFGPIQERQLTQGPASGRRFEARGTVIVRLFGALDVGEAPLAALADSVRAALASQSITSDAGEDLFTTAAAAVPAKSGSWMTTTLTVPFRYYGRR